MRRNVENFPGWSGIVASPEQQAAEDEVRLNKYMARNKASADQWVQTAETAEKEFVPEFNATTVQERLDIGRAFMDNPANPEHPGDDLAVIMAALEKINPGMGLEELYNKGVSQLKQVGKSALPPLVKKTPRNIDAGDRAVQEQFKQSDQARKKLQGQ